MLLYIDYVWHNDLQSIDLLVVLSRDTLNFLN